jgi:hypothetical protein
MSTKSAEYRLRKIRVVVDRAPERVICDPAAREHPPCFDTLANYRLWLATLVEAPPLSRRDFEGEPNYCNDCTQDFKAEMMLTDRCLFPETRFRLQRTNELPGEPSEYEMIGYTPRLSRRLNRAAAYTTWKDSTSTDSSSPSSSEPS